MSHRNGDHCAENCHQLKGLAKRHRGDETKVRRTERSESKSSGSHNRDGGEPNFNQQELNAVAKSMAQKAISGKSTERKRTTRKTEQELNHFENLSISGSESEAISDESVKSDESAHNSDSSAAS